jgi:hypothetical protein
MEAPIKCQVCPYFEPYLRSGKYIYECCYSVCQLRDEEELREQVYDVIKSLKGEK